MKAAPVLIGYFARRPWSRAEDGPCVLPPQVEEMCNVGQMGYHGPPKWMDLYLHNYDFWLYDTEMRAWAAAVDNANLYRLRAELSRQWNGIRGSIEAAMDEYIARHVPPPASSHHWADPRFHWHLYAYRIFPVRFADGTEAPHRLAASSVQPLPADYERLGLDVVSRERDLEFSYSPLDCNGWYTKVAVNRYCLVDDMATAWTLALHWSQDKFDEKGSYIGPAEPGPYYIVEVFRKQRNSGGHL
ncbi:MAG: hypothetical protein WCS94_19750 [Verrucomicrobiota bacterium]